MSRPDWWTKNKHFILALAIFCFPIIMSFAALQIQAQQNSKDIAKIDVREQNETKRSKNVDRERQEQVARIEEKLSNLEDRSREVKRAVDKTNDKLDWLIRNQINGGRE